jgi:hypothetical protein
MLEEKIIEWEKKNLIEDNLIEDMNVKILDFMCVITDHKLEDDFDKVMTKLFYYEEDKNLLLKDINVWKKEFLKVKVSRFILDTPDFSDRFKEVMKEVKLRDLKRVAVTLIPNEDNVKTQSKSLYKRTLECDEEKKDIIKSLNSITASYDKITTPILILNRH